MSKRDLERVEVLARVRSKQLLVEDGGRLMRVGYRHAKRLWKRYREEGAAGLQHRRAGRRRIMLPCAQLRPRRFGRVIDHVDLLNLGASCYSLLTERVPGHHHAVVNRRVLE